MTRRRRVQRGFTLVEALTTIVVLSILGSIGSTLLYTSTDSYLEVATRAQLHTELSTAMDRACREVRMIPLDTSASDIDPDIFYKSGNQIQWGSPVSKIWHSGGVLYLNRAGGPDRILLRDITSFSVQAFDESNAVLPTFILDADTETVRRIEFDATIERNGVSERLRSRVFIRSTMAGA